MIDFMGTVHVMTTGGDDLGEPDVLFVWTGHGWRADNIRVEMPVPTPQMLEPFDVYVTDRLGEKRLVTSIRAEPRVFMPYERIIIGLTLEMPLSCPVCLMNLGAESDPADAIAGIAKIALETE